MVTIDSHYFGRQSDRFHLKKLRYYLFASSVLVLFVVLSLSCNAFAQMNKSRENMSGDRKSVDKKPGDKKSEDSKSGDKKAGGKKSEDKKPGDRKPRDRKSGKEMAIIDAKALHFKDSASKQLKLLGTTSHLKLKTTRWNKIRSISNGKGHIYWAIKNPRIAAITPDGDSSIRVTPKRTGATKIAANYRGKLFYTKVYVDKNPGYVKKDLHGKEAELSNLSPLSLSLPGKIPKYWESELKKSIATARKREELAGNMSSFIFLTDSHWSVNAKKSPAIVNYLWEQFNLSFVMIGGDVISISSLPVDKSNGLNRAQRARKQLKKFYRSFKPNVCLMTTVGNHDSNVPVLNNPKGKDILSDKELYLSMIAKSGPGINTTPGALESWTDDTQHKIRYISFYYDKVHTNGITAKKLEWIDQKVKELDTGWTVVLFSHAYWTNVEKGIDNQIMPEAESLARHLANLDSASQAEIALWMVGHSHRDKNTKIVSDDGNGEINVVSTNCDAFKHTKSEDRGGEKMVKGTSTEQAMDLVQIDTVNRKLYFTRIGAGKDRVLSY